VKSSAKRRSSTARSTYSRAHCGEIFMKSAFSHQSQPKSADSASHEHFSRDPSLRLKNGWAQDEAIDVWPKIPARSRRVSQRLTTVSPKLLQEPYVTLKE